MGKAYPITVYLPDARNVEVSRYGCGNAKLGFGVFTYSRAAGFPDGMGTKGTCPGSTAECEAICYAKRIDGAAKTMMYHRNYGSDVPPIPDECRILRIHISGDFDSVDYINAWIARLLDRPDVTCWAYTRSWRVPVLLERLEALRALPNVQLFASMDPSTPDLPPASWRRAWLWRDAPNEPWPVETRLLPHEVSAHHHRVDRAIDDEISYVCPEETGRKANCLACGYCFEGRKHDVTFLEHHGPAKT